MPEIAENRFAALVDSRGFAKLDENKFKRRRNFFDEGNYSQKYVVIKRIDEENKTFHGVSPFLIEKGLSMITNFIKETQRLRSGDLLVLTSKEEGFNKLLKSVKMADIPIKVEEHKFLNLSKGVIYSRDLMFLKEEEITNELKDQKVIKVERIKRKINNELKDTPLHILTFNTIDLPMQIKAGFLRLDVRMYLPNPMRCHTCQRYGHTKTKCDRVPVCPKCAKQIPNGHENINCEPISCANCKSEHTTFDPNCATFQMEKAIIKIKTIERITYFRAKEIYYRQNANTTGAKPTGTTKPSYSEALKQDIENKIDNSKENTNTNNINNNNNNKNNNNYNNNKNMENKNELNNNHNNNDANNNNNQLNVNTKQQEIKKSKFEFKTTTSTPTSTETTSTCSNKRERSIKTEMPAEGRRASRYSFLNPNELAISLDMDENA